MSTAPVVVTGIVTDLGVGAPSLGLGGRGTLAGATSVRLSALLPSGQLAFLAHVLLAASGKFSAEVPLGLDVLIAEAVDPSGSVLGAATLFAAGAAAGNVAMAAPMTTETSLEAQVLLAGARCLYRQSGAGELVTLSANVAAWIDARIASAVVASASAGVDLELLVEALAQASVAASRSQARALADARVQVNVDAVAQADLDALAKLNRGLNRVLAGHSTPAQVTARLLTDLDAALAAAGSLSADVHVRAQIAASLTFSATLAACLVGVVHAEIVIFAAVHAGAPTEARTVVSMVADALRLAGSSQATVDAAIAAGEKLLVDVGAATNVQMLEQARLDFVTTLCGGTSGTGGLLGSVLVQTTGAADGVLDSALGAVVELTADLDASLNTQLGASVKANVCLDADASARLDATLHVLVQVLVKFAADVHALGPRLEVGTTTRASANALADALAMAQVVLRLRF